MLREIRLRRKNKINKKGEKVEKGASLQYIEVCTVLRKYKYRVHVNDVEE